MLNLFIKTHLSSFGIHSESFYLHYLLKIINSRSLGTWITFEIWKEVVGGKTLQTANVQTWPSDNLDKEVQYILANG